MIRDSVVSPWCTVLCLLFAGVRLDAADIEATLGPHRVLMATGRHEFRYFPDEPVSVISERPLRVLMVVENRTVLLEGSTPADLRPVRTVLTPSTVAGAYDESYAGISAVIRNPNGRQLLGFFHAERPLGGVDEAGTKRFNGTIGLAVSNDGGLTFEKKGPILTASPPDPRSPAVAQGVADVSVVADHTGNWLYAYYTEHTCRDPATGNSRGHIVCMARCRTAEADRLDAWRKYFQGEFQEPGLGGRDTEVAEAWCPHVTYLPSLHKYVMFGCNKGIGFFQSDDGIHWRHPQMLFEMIDVPRMGAEIAMHPTLIVDGKANDPLSGLLLYAYSPWYGHEWPAEPHHLAARTIRFRLADTVKSAPAVVPLAERLKGTRWKNSRNVEFNFTKDGRLLHSGVARAWRVTGENRGEVIFSKTHVDVLEFNTDLTEFRQLIKGGPDSFTGKRQ